MAGGGEETGGIDGTGAWLCMGEWYRSWDEETRNGLVGAGETDGMGDIGGAIPPNVVSVMRFGIAIKCGLTSKERP